MVAVHHVRHIPALTAISWFFDSAIPYGVTNNNISPAFYRVFISPPFFCPTPSRFTLFGFRVLLSGYNSVRQR